MHRKGRVQMDLPFLRISMLIKYSFPGLVSMKQYMARLALKWWKFVITNFGMVLTKPGVCKDARHKHE